MMQFSFDISYPEFISRLEELAAEIVATEALLPGSIAVRSNNGKTVTSHSVCTCELPFPCAPGDKPAVSSIFNVRPCKAKADVGRAILKIADFIHSAAPIPPDASEELKIPNATSSSPYWNVKVNMASPDTIPYLRALILFRLAHYLSGAAPFGCCGMFKECSDARRCIHPNRLYATSCAYRHNLDAGRIFYGKNKNT